MPRYFFTEQAAVPFVISGRTYNFTPTGVVSGRLVGVLEAATDEALADMLSIVGRGVVEIDAQDFELEKKKQSPSISVASSPSNNQVAAPSALQSLSIHPKAGVPRAAGESPEPKPDAPKPLPSVKDVIVVARVSPVQPLVKASDRTAKDSKIAA